MCDEFGSDMDISGNDSGFSDVSDRIDSGSDVSDCDAPIDFASEGIFDEPQDILPDIPSEPEDVYEASALEEIQAGKERLEDLKASLLAGDQAALEMFGLESPDTSEEDGHQKVLTR